MAGRVALLLIAALTFAGCHARTSAPAHAARAAAPPDAAPDLAAVELQFEGALLAHQRRALLTELQDSPTLIPYVLATLENPHAERFPVCARLAAQLRLMVAYELLLAAVADRSSPHRVAALVAAQRLREVPLPLLLQALDDDDDGLRLAVLQDLRDHDDLPFEPVARLLTAANPAVAAAAAAVVPIGPEHAVVLARLDFADAAAGAAAIAQLGCRPLPALVLAAWQQRLPGLAPAVQCAVLTAVQRRPECADRALLLRLVQADGSPRLRFAALHGLLAGNGIGDDWLVEHTTGLPRPLQLLAAVQLLRRDHREGAAILFALAFGDARGDEDDADDDAIGGAGAGGSSTDEAPAAPAGETAPVGPAPPDAVALAARRLLSSVADLPLHRGVEAFEAWSREPRVAQRAALVLPEASAVFARAPR